MPVKNSKSEIETPNSVALLSFLLIIIAGINTVFRIIALFLLSDVWDIKVALLVIIPFVGSVFLVVMGVYMIKGQNWARMLFICLAPIFIIFEYTGFEVNLRLNILAVLYILIVVFFTRSEAVAYFKKSRM